MRYTLLFVLAFCIQTAKGQTTLLAEDDFFNTNEDSSLTVTGPGLFENDILVDDSLSVLLVSEPSNGQVVINHDGSFTYTPDPFFNGIDSFTYRIESIPLQVLEIDTLQSALNFDMTVDLPIVGEDDAEGAGRIGGTTYLYVHNGEAQLYDMSLQIIDPLSLGFRFRAGIITVARLFVDAEPGAFMLSQSQRSAPSEVVDGFFRQDSTKVQVMGTVLLTGTGLIEGQVPEDPEEFDTETEAAIGIQMTFTDSTLTAEVPIDLFEAFELSGVSVDMEVQGQLTASGPLKPSMASEAVVTITVDPLSRASVGDESILTYSLSQNFPNPIRSTTTITYSIETTDHVRLRIYDVLGREVAVLVDEVQVPGQHQVQVDAASLSSGMYLYRLETGNFTDARSMVVMK